MSWRVRGSEAEVEARATHDAAVVDLRAESAKLRASLAKANELREAEAQMAAGARRGVQ